MRNKKARVIFLLALACVAAFIPLNTYFTTGQPYSHLSQINLNRIFLVEQRSDSFEDDFMLLSTIPANIFSLPNGTKVLGPIIQSDLDDSSQIFLSDWKRYCDIYGGVKQVIVVGNVSLEQRRLIERLTDQRAVPQISEDDVFKYSNKIASFDWANSETVVLAVIEDPKTFSYQSDYNLSVLNFINVKSDFYSFSDTVLSGYDKNYNVTVADNVGWWALYVDWYKDNVLCHEVTDPTGFIIDNTTAYTTYYTRSLGRQRLVSIIPNVAAGVWSYRIENQSDPGVKENFTVTIKKYPGIFKNVDVGPNTLWLNASISWANPYVTLDLIAVSPSGRLVDWDILSETIKTTKSVSIPFPENGTWTFLTAWWEGVGSLNVNFEVKTTRFSPEIVDSLMAGQNGAVIASMLNAPLLFTKAEELSDYTRDTLIRLETKRIILIDVNNRSSENLIDALSGIAAISSHLVNITQIFDYIKAMNPNNEIVITFPLDNYASTATLIAAYQNKPIIFLSGGNITDLARGSWAPFKLAIKQTIQGSAEHPQYYEKSYMDERVPKYHTMVEVAGVFDTFIGGLFSIENLTITLIAPETIIPVSFDRSIIGKYVIGRYSNSYNFLDGVLMRDLFRNALNLQENLETSLLTFYAYTQGASFTDNYGVVKQVFNRDNVTAILQDKGFTIEQHIGLQNIKNELAKGVSLLVISTHGVIDITGIRNKTRLLVRSFDMPSYYEPSGTLTSPDINNDGFVDPLEWHEEESYFTYISRDWVEQNILRLDNTMIFITACLIGPGLSAALINKGALFVIGSYRTVSFPAACWFNYLSFKNYMSNQSIGESLKEALKNTGTIYTPGYENHSIVNEGFTMQFIVYGDPTLRFSLINSARTHCISIDDFPDHSHTPSKGIGLIAILGDKDYLPSIIEQINVESNWSLSFNFLNISSLNSSALTNEIFNYKAIFIQSDAVVRASNMFINKKSDIERYLLSGGTIVVFNATGPLEWLPLSAGSLMEENGSTVNYSLTPHPLKNYPVALMGNYSYDHVLVNYSHDYDVIASGFNGAVWLASNIETGKISVLSIQADILRYKDLITNLLVWPDLKGLRLAIEVTPTTPILYTDEKIFLSVRVNDIFNWPVVNSSVNVTVNGKDIHPISVDRNEFIFNLTGEVKLGTLNIEVLTWKIDAEPAVSNISIEVRDRPWLLIVIGIIAVISIFGYAIFKVTSSIRKSVLINREYRSQGKVD